MNMLIRCMAVLSMVVIISIGSTPVHAAGQTAKASLPEVLAKAKGWQGDATLVHLSTVKAQSDGTALEWKYAFYSPKTQKRCVVTARGGSVALKEVRLGNYTEPLGEFVDSDKAMEVSKKHDLKGSEPSMGVGRPAGSKAEGTYWIVTGGWKNGDVTISLDAKTGKLIKRTVIGSEK